MYSGINRLMRNFTPLLYAIKDKDGKTLTENEEFSNRWKEYCSEMYEDNTNEEMKQVESNDESLEPTRSEVEWAIKQLPKGKSAEGAVEGRRGRGRLRRRWTQDISDWLGFSVREASILAQDRDGFRSAVWEATSHKNPP
ncbi:endonuclease-reverse transcriptase [Elysia marginata]|uniref:Endonuclease-reverse transcriptase n=1 Tax=Elysia marginata TaxID=1093978 RepID=A0AAV4HQG3_9GAST|nr:endonuclease-reverse transcriptase [Elysia marginata]